MLLCSATVLAEDRDVPSDSLEYAAFALKLRAVFTEDQTLAIISKLPPKCKVYGYDIGDISGDSLPDVVLSYKADDAPKRELGVVILLADSGDFSIAQTLTRSYIAEPIEVGFSIDEGVCHVTRKRAEYHWEISGYTAWSGVFRQADYWETQRLRFGNAASSIGFEQFTDFRTHRSTENYYRVSDGKVLLRHESTALPVFPAGSKIPADAAIPIADTTYGNLLKGSSSWSGPDDCGMFLSAVYDTAAIVFTLRLLDDRLLFAAEPEGSDRLQLYFDLSGKRKLESTGKPRSGKDEPLMAVTVLMGDGDRMPPVVVVSAPPDQSGNRPLSRSVKARMEKSGPGSYTVTCTIPRGLFPRDATWIPFTTLYNDVDVPEHPEWVTVSATSDDFDPASPATYGRLYFLEADKVPFERENLNLRRMITRMRRAGIVGG